MNSKSVMVVDSGQRKVEVMAAKKAKRKKSRPRKSGHTKTKPATKPAAKGRSKRKRAAPKPKKRRGTQRGRANAAALVAYEQHGLGAHSGGQSGDTQGFSANSAVESESVEELLEEGQSYEAEVLDGVENAPDPDQSEVRTREVTQDDVPGEYREED